jgi:DNA-binding response OmpR family regulator
VSQKISVGFSPEPRARGRALLVEDNRADRELVSRLLASEGFVPVPVDRPEEAVARAEVAEPGLIILSADVKNGFNLCLRFKKHDALRNIPIILLTERSSDDVVRKHQKLATRADAYVRKPVDESVFVGIIENLFGTHEIEFGDGFERTLVSNHGIENAVVDFVEEEVRSLRNMVRSLEKEKADLSSRLGELSGQLQSQHQLLDSGLKALLSRDALDTDDGADGSTDAPERRPARGRKAREEARQEGLDEGRRLGREEALAEAQAGMKVLLEERDTLLTERERLRAQVTEDISLRDEARLLQARVVELEDKLVASARREAQLQSDLGQTTDLFSRLEAGYKDNLEAAEAEKVAAEEALAKVEEKAAILAERVAELEETTSEIASLQEAAARADLLHEELEQLKARDELLEKAERQIEELQSANQAQAAQIGEMIRMKKDFEATRKSEIQARREITELQDRMARIRRLLDGTDEGGEE